VAIFGGHVKRAAFLFSLLCFGTQIVHAQVESCRASDGRPVAVCFEDKPITLDRCTKKLIPHFQILRSNDEPYYFTYRLMVIDDAGKGLYADDAPVDEFKKQENPYSVHLNDPLKTRPTSMKYDYLGPASYHLEITAYVKGTQPITETAIAYLSDVRRVRAVIVGISTYKNSADTQSDSQITNLKHADNDARAFALFATQAFPGLQMDVLTSDQDPLPTKENIMKALKDARDDKQFCSQDDLFIFYFSGHGILANESTGVRHYISTQNLDSSNVSDTAVRLKELVQTIVEDLGAGNKLMILDSCFSGTVRTLPSTGASSKLSKKLIVGGNRSSGKIAFVDQGKFVPAFDMSTGDDEDIDAVATEISWNDRHRGDSSVLYLSAAASDHEAEEGVVGVANGQLEFKKSNQETDVDMQKGHGLYTYSLILELEGQVYRFHDVLGLDEAIQNKESCKISFFDAHDEVNHLLFVLRNKPGGENTQRPDYKRTETPLEEFSCSQ
jgi:hypothetical protein